MTKPQDKNEPSTLISTQQEKKLARTSETKIWRKTDLPADFPPDQKDLIYREIAFFRERLQWENESVREKRRTRSCRAKVEKERERSHGREIRERERERGRERDRSYGHYHQSVNFVPARESRRESYVLDDDEEEQRRQAKRKTEMDMAFKEVYTYPFHISYL
jgi:hypothetical protein